VTVDAPTLALVLVKATTLLLAGAIVAGLLRRAPAGARHLVWLATLAGLLALPASSRLTPLPLPILPAAEMAAANAEPPARAAAGPAGPRAPARAAMAMPRPVTHARLDLAMLWSLALGVWAAVALALAAWLASGVLAARRIVRAARPLDDARWQALLCEVADRLDIRRLPRIVASDRVDVPFACGILQPTIVLPAAAHTWADDRRRLVVVHELAHIRRRDLAAHAVARLACAAYWFHPLVWGAARRLRAESERACDDLVLACGARATDYAGLLLDVVSATRRHGAPATAVPMARRRELEGRVLAILDPGVRRGQPGRAQSAGLLAGLAALFLLVAASAPYAPAQTVAPPPGAPSAASDDTRDARAEERAERAAGKAERAAERRQEQRDADRPARLSDDSRAVLVRVLHDDTDASVRRSAVWALAQQERLGDPAAIVAALRTDADDDVREMAAWALADARAGDARGALAEALRHDRSDAVKATAAWALGQEEGADAAALAAAVSASAPEVRRAAIWAIGNQNLQKAPATLAGGLRDADEEVRLVTAWALGEILDPATEPALEAAFAVEKDADVKRAIFRTLAHLGDASAEVIAQALQSKDAELRSHAVLLEAGQGPGVWPWPWPWPQPRPMP
jgi:beta-lactamase regulating signal transducer with metallopeptidase domain/HEAT repeat protein